ncbi:DUF4145 domain-containing protein [Nocardioides alpinus]|uniref:DUF4145 domain-containing protein n=1 Tax=Nocardioides alpinus TaxID=748909 RepID=UPI0012FED5BE|nr:DUF4145 domain-containing protein [Nocardioides alpinus]
MSELNIQPAVRPLDNLRLMTIDPALRQLASEIEDGAALPSPRCPDCGVGTVSFAAPTKFETAGMREARKHDAYDPDWEKGTFVMQGVCGAHTCQQVVVATGTWRVDYGTTGGYPESYADQFAVFYRVRQVHPPLRLMELPDDAAVNEALGGIAEGLLTAGAVLFTAPGLAATSLRGCIERFLSNAGISRKTAKDRFRPLDRRLVEWREKDADRDGIADLMLAVKWLGNTGTHEDSVLTAADVLEGARLLDEAFHRLYVSPAITAAAAAINAAEGPVTF